MCFDAEDLLLFFTATGWALEEIGEGEDGGPFPEMPVEEESLETFFDFEDFFLFFDESEAVESTWSCCSEIGFDKVISPGVDCWLDGWGELTVVEEEEEEVVGCLRCCDDIDFLFALLFDVDLVDLLFDCFKLREGEWDGEGEDGLEDVKWGGFDLIVASIVELEEKSVDWVYGLDWIRDKGREEM